jgi:hypothetical protein
MRSYGLQIVLAIVALIGIVGGVTYMSFYQTTAPLPKEPPPPPPTKGTGNLRFVPTNSVQWDPPWFGDFEVHQPGQYDFWFENTKQTPVELGLRQTSCKCSSVQVAIFTAEEKAAYLTWMRSSVAAEISKIPSGALEFVSQLWIDKDFSSVANHAHPKFHRLAPEDKDAGPGEEKSVDVPPGGKGLVRLVWDGTRAENGKHRLTITLWSQARTEEFSPRDYPQLELPLNYIDPLVLPLKSISLDELFRGQEKTAHFSVWSSTRAAFGLTAEESSHDPCISCTIRPLGDEEREAITKETGSRALSGYRVDMTVHERLSDSVQMELGPFLRRIVLTSPDVSNESAVLIAGVVRGEITVGAEEDKGKVNFKSFKTQFGATKTVRILAMNNGLELDEGAVRVEPEELNYVKAKLRRVPPLPGENASRWDLVVTIPPNTPPLQLPVHSAVFVKTRGNPPRQIRIPLEGRAYQ